MPRRPHERLPDTIEALDGITKAAILLVAVGAALGSTEVAPFAAADALGSAVGSGGGGGGGGGGGEYGACESIACRISLPSLVPRIFARCST